MESTGLQVVKMATAAQAELGISGVTTDPLTADPYYIPDKIVENNLTNRRVPCVHKPFEGTGGSSSSPYQWEVPPDPSLWLDAELFIKGRYRIVVKDETTGEPRPWKEGELTHIKDHMGLIDNISQTMWGKISLQDNGMPLEDPNPKPYPFRYKFECLLNFDEKKKTNVLKYSQNCLTDAREKDDKDTVLIAAAKTRFNNLASNTYQDFETVIHTDFLSMDNQIPTQNQLRLVLERMADEFIFIEEQTEPPYLKTNNAVKPTLQLKNVELKFHKSEPSSNRRKSGFAPVTIGRMRDKAIPPNNTNFNWEGVFRGEDLPQQVLVTLLSQKAWNGSFDTDPFQWKKPPSGIVEACLVVDGVHYEPLEKLTNCKNGEDGYGDLEMYMSTIRATGYQYLTRDGTLDITKDQWDTDSFFLAFDRSPGKNNSLSTIFRPKPGQHMDLVLHLKEGYTETMVLLVFGIYKTYLEFNADGSLNRIPHIIC